MLTRFVLAAALTFGAGAQAQSLPSTQGSLVVVAANGEVTRPNDQADATFFIEEQDKDKAVAASKVNSKMKEGMAILRKADPSAELKSYGYYSYPVYEERQPQPNSNVAPKRTLIGWRIGQYVNMQTRQLESLPKTVAAAQQLLALQGLNFGLSPAAAKKLDADRIQSAYEDFTTRLAAIAKAMGRQPGDAVVELIDYEASGRYGNTGMESMAVPMKVTGSAMRKGGMPEVAEPSFEPGDTTLNLRMVAKVRFK